MYQINDRQRLDCKMRNICDTISIDWLKQFILFQNIRINAIEILTAIASYPTFVVLPFAQDVLFGLQPALDDHKRIVRSAAVSARNKWFLVGAEE